MDSVLKQAPAEIRLALVVAIQAAEQHRFYKCDEDADYYLEDVNKAANKLSNDPTSDGAFALLIVRLDRYFLRQQARLKHGTAGRTAAALNYELINSLRGQGTPASTQLAGFIHP